MIFIAGNSRSGTTLMGRILANHSQVFTFNELHFLEETWMPVSDELTLTETEAIKIYSNLISIQREGYLKKRMPEKYFDEAADAVKSFNRGKMTFAFLYQYFLCRETERNQKSIPCEKTPRNVLYIKELSTIYPSCKIVCMIRDPKDVLLSQKKKWKRRFLGAAASIPLKESIRARINYHPFIISRLWNVNAQEIEKHKKNLHVITLSFESLLSNPEKEIRNLCTFLEIPFEAEMLRVQKKGSSSEFDAIDKLEIDKKKIGNWKNGLSNTEVYICEKMTRHWRSNFNYPETGIRPNYFLLAFYYFIFPLQVFIALAVNLGRTKNILQSIRKRFM